ncbi:DUF4153 domain-containing protein [Bacillus salacetis]|nr:DUF4173 domain-containing protein [Bacillus salacetis]
MKKRNLLLILSSILMGVLAEWLFVDHVFGLSVLLYVSLYYCLFYWQMKGRLFRNRKIGFLLMLSILSLSLGYFLYWNITFYLLNLLVLPAFIIVHSVIITRRKTIDWNNPAFIGFMFSFTGKWIAFTFGRIGKFKKVFQRRMNSGSYQTFKRVLIGLLISVPLVGFIGILLVSADNHFAELMARLPLKFFNLQIGDEIFRTIFVLMVSLILYSFIRMLRRNEKDYPRSMDIQRPSWETTIIVTVLISLNALYALFTFVQFQYFFSDTLLAGYTYADYARRGFFELIVVTLINWSIVVAVIKSSDKGEGVMSRVTNILLTLLIGMSGIMLYSAAMRLGLYEEAYGFTMSRVLAHSFMALIGVILAFTLLKIWYVRLSLSRFYIITVMIIYSGLNLVDLNGLIVEKNIDRYEQTGKIDLYYFEQMSYAGTLGLIDLYKQDPSLPGLKELLVREQEGAVDQKESWQSTNLVKKEAEKKLEKLELR